MNGRVAVFRMNRLLRSAFRRVGLEIQIVPLPRHKIVTRGSELRNQLLNSQVNWLRVPMYESITSSLAKQGGPGYLEGKSAIEIGGSEGTIARALKSLGASIQVAPDYPLVDAENLPYAAGAFDVVVLDQILEHLKHPWIAVDQIRRVLRSGGICVSTSVFVYPLHRGFVGSFDDYYRFSPQGFRALFEGFKILESDGWGNADVLRLAYNHSDRGPEGTDPVQKQEADRLGLYDRKDEMNYLMTWCIAQKA
ncbi:MAG: class I SAM-dependent methyltransferase [Thaumarchaeota archaeon]|nr:class I SAM-dependent methyltransferase [Nitrososphaerota archaeon]